MGNSWQALERGMGQHGSLSICVMIGSRVKTGNGNQIGVGDRQHLKEGAHSLTINQAVAGGMDCRRCGRVCRLGKLFGARAYSKAFKKDTLGQACRHARAACAGRLAKGLKIDMGG